MHLPASLRLLPRLTAAISLGDEASAKKAAAAALRGGVRKEAIYEAALQTYLFAGYPRGISGLAAVHAAIGPALRPLTRGTPASLRRRGYRLCTRIYGASTERMLANMRKLHPALAEWIVDEGYGKVLARPGLTPAEREACAVAALAALKAWPQLESHARGALRVGLPLEALKVAAGPSSQARRIVADATSEVLPNAARHRSLH